MARKPFLTPSGYGSGVETRCIEIPSDPQWLGIFNSALLETTYWWNYEQVNPTDLEPEEVAQICYGIFERYLAGECGTVDDVRQNPFNPCTLEKTFDGGETWIPFANLLACEVPGLAAGSFRTGQLRVDELTGKPQYSPDGEVWVDVPPAGSTGPNVAPPGPTPGADNEAKICLAATRAVIGISEFYRATVGAFAAGFENTLGTLNNFLYDINTALFNLIYSPYEGILEAWLFQQQDFETNYTAPALSEAAQDALRCLLYDNASVSEAGVVTFDFGAVYDNVIAELGINPGTAVTFLLGYIQEAGLNAAGGIAATDTADCTDCGQEPGYAFNWTHVRGSGAAGEPGLASPGLLEGTSVPGQYYSTSAGSFHGWGRYIGGGATNTTTVTMEWNGPPLKVSRVDIATGRNGNSMSINTLKVWVNDDVSPIFSGANPLMTTGQTFQSVTLPENREITKVRIEGVVRQAFSGLMVTGLRLWWDGEPIP